MDLLDINLQAFQKRYPEGSLAYQGLRSASVPADKPIHLFPSRNIEIPSGSARLCLFKDIGDGILLQKIHSQFQGSLVFAILIHDPRNLMALMSRMDLSPLFKDPLTEWFIGAPENDIFFQFIEYFHAQDRRLMAATSILTINAFEADQKTYYDSVEVHFLAARDQVRSGIGPPEDGYQGLCNIIRNIDHHFFDRPLFDSLAGLFKGKPGVVISSGPSLTASLSYLKRIQDKAILFCCDSAVKILIENGIKPHFVACLERVLPTSRLFDGMRELHDTWLVGNPLLHPEAFKNYKGPSCYLMRDGAQLGWFFPDVPVHNLGQSCSHMAYWGLHLLGCETIYLVGQDLAFDPFSSRSHAEGIPEATTKAGERIYADLKATKAQGNPNWVEGNSGKPILSWYWYINFIHCFTSLIRDTGRKCINLISQDYGAKIPGAIWMSPDKGFEQISNEADKDIRPTIKEALISTPSLLKVKDGFNHHVEEGKHYINKVLIPGWVGILHQISIFQQEKLFDEAAPFEPGDALGFLNWITREDETLISKNNSIFNQLLGAILWKIRVDLSYKTAEILKGEGVTFKGMTLVLEELGSYYRNALAWVAQVAGLLERINDQEGNPLNQP